ncbi:MmgE/PrpD family protein (plasmid) [Mesorhizobium sp. ORM8.1]
MDSQPYTDWRTYQLVDYATSTRFEAYPADVVHAAKRLILDSIGCMFGGSQSPIGQSMLRAYRPMLGAPQAVLVGTPDKGSAVDAAMFNATAANALDFDDTKPGAHLGASVIPSVLALAGPRALSGAQFLDAVIVGYDVGNRVGAAIQPTPARMKEVWGTGTWHTFGSVAASAKAAGLSVEKTLNAFGIAGTTAPVPSGQKWGWPVFERPIHWVKEGIGWSAHAGTLAALLAEQGFIGNRYILDGETGFWRMFGSDQVDFERMVDGLGSKFEVQTIGFKPFPCCRWQHTALAAIKGLQTENSFSADDVKQVDIHSFNWVKLQEVYDPSNIVDSQFSMPHNAAAMLLGLAPGAEWGAEATLSDRRLRDYSRRIKVTLDPEMNALYDRDKTPGSRVEIALNNGRTYSRTLTIPPGSPDNPMSDTDLQGKFLSLCGTVAGSDVAQRLLDHIWNLERAADMVPILELCTIKG